MKTQRIHHVQINVSDIDRSIAFYTGFLGMQEAFRAGGLVFLSSDGTDLLTLNPVDGGVDPEAAGLQHFGFLVSEEEMGRGLEEARQQGIEIVSTGQHGKNERYMYLKDPDGYLVELDTSR